MFVLTKLANRTTAPIDHAKQIPCAWLRMSGKEAQDLLFPSKCIGCHAFGYLLCPECAQQPKPPGSAICQRCGRPQSEPRIFCSRCQDESDPPLDLARAATLFGYPLRTAIHLLKYEDMKELSDLLARYLLAAYMQPIWGNLLRQPELIAPVPMYSKREAERGYNQAALLGSSFARLVNKPYSDEWLRRTSFTRPQVGLNAQERQQNVAGAFEASSVVAGKAILLIDDVYTTGATLRACAAALKQAGAGSVYALTIAAPDLESDGL